MLASDPDREGEAIAWHVLEELRVCVSELHVLVLVVPSSWRPIADVEFASPSWMLFGFTHSINLSDCSSIDSGVCGQLRAAATGHRARAVCACVETSSVPLLLLPLPAGSVQPAGAPTALQGKKLLRGVAVQRVTFVEVTRSAVLAALAAPRDLATPLIEAYLARRALDYLLGFHLTPVLWRKLPAARSAGG